MLISVSDWLDEFTGQNFIWYVKRLSGNDTLANGSHQAGPYVPRDFIFQIFPSMEGKTDDNQKRWIDVYIDSHSDYAKACVTWYNNKFRDGTRNETRLTNFGGQNSALLDPESTGALTVFAFELDSNGEAKECHVWVAQHETEEDVIEDRVGIIEPGTWKIWTVDEALFDVSKPAKKNLCWLDTDDIPTEWLIKFPTGFEIIRKTVELSPATNLDPDKRLMKRRICEYDLFRSVEQAIELPEILKGFSNVEEFIKKAQSILQRRKSRSGRSLELHAMEIFIEEGLEHGADFSHQPISEQNKKPDFLFPSVEYYEDINFPEEKIRMLAVKTTCKDRWRQILNEADRVKTKHLLTLQEGISVNQFQEMQKENVQLVVPSPVIPTYASEIQPHIQTLESFIGDVRLLRLSS